MTKEQLIRIAKVGFPERVKQFIDFDTIEMQCVSNVWRLYERDTPFILTTPKDCYISIHIDSEDKFVQIQTEHRAFNHYAAIKEMELMGII